MGSCQIITGMRVVVSTPPHTHISGTPLPCALSGFRRATRLSSMATTRPGPPNHARLASVSVEHTSFKKCYQSIMVLSATPTYTFTIIANLYVRLNVQICQCNIIIIVVIICSIIIIIHQKMSLTKFLWNKDLNNLFYNSTKILRPSRVSQWVYERLELLICKLLTDRI